MALGTQPAPHWTIAHLSDTHLLGDGKLLHEAIDTRDTLRRTLDRIAAASDRFDAIVVSGDIADLGEPSAYRAARDLLTERAERLGATLIVTAGNHDERGAFREVLSTDGRAPEAPIDGVTELDGLRIVTLDSSLPGWHHGGFDPGQADWLRSVLATRAPHGTILVMHHPPMPYRSELMQLIEFRDTQELADILRGSDVRAVLSGHLHVNGSGTIVGIPVVLASATSYADDLGIPVDTFVGVDSQQSCNILEVYEDTIAHWVVAVDQGGVVSALPRDLTERLRALPIEERLTRFSEKPIASE